MSPGVSVPWMPGYPPAARTEIRLEIALALPLGIITHLIALSHEFHTSAPGKPQTYSNTYVMRRVHGSVMDAETVEKPRPFGMRLETGNAAIRTRRLVSLPTECSLAFSTQRRSEVNPTRATCPSRNCHDQHRDLKALVCQE